MTRHPSMPALWPSRLYYGWAIVGVAFLMNAVASPLNPATFGFFIGPIGDDLGVSRSGIAWAYTIRLLVSGATAPLLGVFLDKAGARRLGVVVGLVGGGALVGQAAVHEVWAFYLLAALPGLVGFGGPLGTLVTSVPASRWFVRRRGRAMAIATIGGPAGSVVSLLVAQPLLDAFGWRGAFVVYGVFLAAVTVPLSALFVRRSPEDLGLHPDGDAEPLAQFAATRPASGAQDTEVDWTLSQALRTTAFWVILVALGLTGMAISGTLLHRAEFWKGTGMSPQIVAVGIASDPFTVIFSAMLFGFLAERLPLRYLGLFAGGGMALSMLPMIFTTGQTWTIFANNIAWGVAAGAYITVHNLVHPRFFGRRHVGAIRGMFLPASVVATGVGGPLIGYLLDTGVDPSLVWTMVAGLFATTGVLLVLARAPVPRHREPASRRPMGS